MANHMVVTSVRLSVQLIHQSTKKKKKDLYINRL